MTDSAINSPPPAEPGGASELLRNAIRLQELGRIGEAERLYRQILSADGRHADALHLLGTIACQAGHRERAVALVRKAIAIDPGVAAYHSNLGNMLQLDGHLAEAASCYERALELSPHFADARNNLGNLLERMGKPHQAVAQLRQAVALNPESPEAHISLGSALTALGDWPAALEHFGRALDLDPENARAHYNRAMLRLLLGEFQPGWRAYEWRRKLHAPRGFAQPEWQGEPLQGARILLYSEQGLGDTIQFLRYVPMVQAAGGAVVLETPERLRRMVAQIPGLAGVAARGEKLPEFAWRRSLMSLPLVFETDRATIPARVPYLRVPREAAERAAGLAWPKLGLRVGLAWAGSPTHGKDVYRSLRLAQLEPLLALGAGQQPRGGVRFFSLQMGDASAQLASSPVPIRDLAPVTGDMADTAAQMEHLDLVIAVDTSVAHLAGALGRLVWILLPYSPDWRWLLDREDSPWYPTARLFRQSAPGAWTEAVSRVRVALEALLAGRSR